MNNIEEKICRNWNLYLIDEEFLNKKFEETGKILEPKYKYRNESGDHVFSESFLLAKFDEDFAFVNRTN